MATQITQGQYSKNIENVMPEYSDGCVITTSGSLFTGAGYLTGMVFAGTSASVDGTVVLYDYTTVSSAHKIVDVVAGCNSDGLGSKSIMFSSPLRVSTGLYAAISNAKLNVFYRT